MILELPEELETALKVKANARGVSPAGYVCETLKRELDAPVEPPGTLAPFKSGRGSFAKYGPAPSAEEIEPTARTCFAASVRVSIDRSRGGHTRCSLVFVRRCPAFRTGWPTP